MRETFRSVRSVFTLTLFLAACGGATNPRTPAEARRFPQQNCSVDQVEVTAEASLVRESEEAALSTFLAKVCLSCAGQPITGFSGVRAAIDSPPEGTPVNVAGLFGFPPTNDEGCTSVAFRGVPAEFAGRQLVLRLSDSDGKPLKSEPVMVQVAR